MTGKIRNVGPKSAAWLRQVGVRTTEDLARIGPVETFLKVKRAGFRPSLNLLYALEGALLGCHWQQVPDDRRTQLLAEAEEASLSLPLPKHKRMAAMGGVVRDVSPAHANGGDGDADSGAMESTLGFDDPAAESDHEGGDAGAASGWGGDHGDSGRSDD